MLLRHFRRPNRQRGDTLVEVLVAIAVVTLVLSGAYVVTNRSVQETRSAQERGNALKNAESQLEQLKGLIATSPDAVFGVGAPSPFCVYTASQTVAIVAATNANCTVGTNGAATTTEPKFTLSMTRSGQTFTLVETWTDVSGRGGTNGDRLQLVYRLYD